jgi:hypothetical protein
LNPSGTPHEVLGMQGPQDPSCDFAQSIIMHLVRLNEGRVVVHGLLHKTYAESARASSPPRTWHTPPLAIPSQPWRPRRRKRLRTGCTASFGSLCRVFRGHHTQLRYGISLDDLIMAIGFASGARAGLRFQ